MVPPFDYDAAVKELIRRSRGRMFTKLGVELSSYCNRDCDFCNRSHDRSGRRKTAEGKKVREQMPSDLFVSILNQAKYLGYTGTVGFHGLSEPMCDDRVVWAAKQARKNGMRPYLVTNGDRLRTDTKLRKAVVKGPQVILDPKFFAEINTLSQNYHTIFNLPNLRKGYSTMGTQHRKVRNIERAKH